MSKYVLLDTNCLIVLLIGLLDEGLLRRFTKTKDRKYVDSFAVLQSYFYNKDTVFVANSYLMCELSHQTIEHKDFPNRNKKDFIKILQELIENEKIKITETAINQILPHKSLFYLGMADVSLLLFKNIMLLTFDQKLHQDSLGYQIPSILFPL